MRLVLLAALALGCAVLNPARAQPGAPSGPPAVGVAPVRSRAITETSEFVGRIQAVKRVDVVARVTAFIEKRSFTKGTECRAGAPLYTPEKPQFEGRVASAAAAVAQAEARLTNNQLNLRRAEM